MDVKELSKYWDNSFIKYDDDKLNVYKLNRNTVDFLSKVGLPNGEKAKEKLAYNFLEIDNMQKKIINDEEYIKIEQYRNSDGFIAVKVNTEEIFYISLADERYVSKDIVKYCNKNIENFILFCTILGMNYDNIENDELEGYQCARETVEEFKKIDIKSVCQQSYWINILMDYAIDYFYDMDEDFQKVLKEKRYKT